MCAWREGAEAEKAIPYVGPSRTSGPGSPFCLVGEDHSPGVLGSERQGGPQPRALPWKASGQGEGESRGPTLENPGSVYFARVFNRVGWV